MTSLWKVVVRRILQLAFSLALFVYIVAAVGDQRFMAIERADIQLMAQRMAVADLQYRDPKPTLEESIRTQNEYQAEAAKRYGFDKPFLVRVHLRVVRLLTEGLGESRMFGVARPIFGGYRYQISHDVSDIIANSIVPTVMLFFGAFSAQIALAFFLGLWAARRPGSMLDRTTTVAGYLGASMPPFIAALLVMIFLVYSWRLFPGDIWIYRWPTTWSGVGPWVANFLSYYTLPFLTLVLIGFGTWAVQFRNIVLNVYNEDFVATARARGLAERRVVYGHVARTSSPPLVSAITMGLASSIFGCYLVEAVFHWPGIGWLFWQAVAPEPPKMEDKLIFGIMLVTGVFYIVASFALELVYRLLDPRIKAGGERQRL